MSVAVSPAMKTPAEEVDLSRSLQCAVLDGGEIAVVRVLSRGNFNNSMPLKRFAQLVQSEGKVQRFVVDLQFCESMDSTFMGVLAGIAIAMYQKQKAKLVVFGASDHCKRLLKNLGLLPLVELKDGQMTELERSEGSLKSADSAACTRIEQIYLTLNAHKELCRIDSQNEMRFQAVIEYLEKSLNEEGTPGA